VHSFHPSLSLSFSCCLWLLQQSYNNCVPSPSPSPPPSQQLPVRCSPIFHSSEHCISSYSHNNTRWLTVHLLTFQSMLSPTFPFYLEAFILVIHYVSTRWCHMQTMWPVLFHFVLSKPRAETKAVCLLWYVRYSVAASNKYVIV
jgi:hypothetical protein